MEIVPHSTSEAAAFSPPMPPEGATTPVLPGRGDTTDLINRILAMSASLFPGPVSYEHSYHPEDPSNEYVVFDVVAAGEYAQYRDRIFQWHDEVEKLAPGSIGEFRLIVHPKR